MVRLFWQVEDGYSAYVPPGGLLWDTEAHVHHATVDIELAGQVTPIQGIFTLPANYLQDVGTSTVGVLLAHGNQAQTWKGKLLNGLATALAQKGHLVVRYYCNGKEQRRLRLLEKVLDAATTSPYARGVTRWVLGGIGSGARVCANVGVRCRAHVAGYLFMAYPLQEPMAIFKGPTAPDSSGPLLKLTAPLLIVVPGEDPLCKAEQVKELVPRIPSRDVRLVEVPGVDGTFRDPATHAPPSAEVRARLAEVALTYVQALTNGSLLACNEALPLVRDPAVDPPPPPHVPANTRPPLNLPPHHLIVTGSQPVRPVQRLPLPAISLLSLSAEKQAKEQLAMQEVLKAHGVESVAVPHDVAVAQAAEEAAAAPPAAGEGEGAAAAAEAEAAGGIVLPVRAAVRKAAAAAAAGEEGVAVAGEAEAEEEEEEEGQGAAKRQRVDDGEGGAAEAAAPQEMETA